MLHTFQSGPSFLFVSFFWRSFYHFSASCSSTHTHTHTHTHTSILCATLLSSSLAFGLLRRHFDDAVVVPFFVLVFNLCPTLSLSLYRLRIIMGTDDGRFLTDRFSFGFFAVIAGGRDRTDATRCHQRTETQQKQNTNGVLTSESTSGSAM